MPDNADTWTKYRPTSRLGKMSDVVGQSNSGRTNPDSEALAEEEMPVLRTLGYEKRRHDEQHAR